MDGIMSCAAAMVRVLTNTAVLAALGWLAGPRWAVGLGILGAVTGLSHAVAICTSGGYPKSLRGASLLVLHHTWGLVGMVAGSLFLWLNLLAGNSVVSAEEGRRPDRGLVQLREPFLGGRLRRLGGVLAGSDPSTSDGSQIELPRWA
jgi:hypothetical protein